MISAKQAKIMSNNATVNLKKQQKLLEKNKNKEFYIPLPFKLKMVEYLIEQAIEVGLTYCNIDNEITPECEEYLIENGYSVKWYKNFVKVSW